MKEEIKKWKTKEGKELLLSEMETSHIKNAHKLLLKNGYIGTSTLMFYLTCAPPTGDMAEYYFEQELNALIRSPVSPWIDYFEAELKKRGVEIERID